MPHLSIEEAARIYVRMADDYAGQVGGKIDPETRAPIGGIIFDCNQHGHTMRPYVPPNTTPARAQADWTAITPPVVGLPSKRTLPQIYAAPNVAYRWELDEMQNHWLVTAGYNPYSHLWGIIASYSPTTGTTWQVSFLTATLDGRHSGASVAPRTDAHLELTIQSEDHSTPTDAQAEHRATVRTIADEWNALSAEQKAAWNKSAHRAGYGGYAAFVQNAFRPNPVTR